MRDQDLIIGESGTYGRDLGFRRYSPLLRGDQRRLEGGNVVGKSVGKSVGTGIHGRQQIMDAGAAVTLFEPSESVGRSPHPAVVGRQVRCGCRQSKWGGRPLLPLLTFRAQ
ncbi:MAG TPA: hypothetical protein VHL31_13440 [Geminicoccus sp.]|uniref:hypothetical protein n=1 Tax=Geminicoccus sp. TaxID=2024832 RepID=UPI002E2EBE04|nr:hypothetical protein [Geminicoccus sp.]HEX2527286.1 hypothetical protein [Geminicoccus sp.]